MWVTCQQRQNDSCFILYSSDDSTFSDRVSSSGAKPRPTSVQTGARICVLNDSGFIHDLPEQLHRQVFGFDAIFVCASDKFNCRNMLSFLLALLIHHSLRFEDIWNWFSDINHLDHLNPFLLDLLNQYQRN
jgi:hypothetical protein